MLIKKNLMRLPKKLNIYIIYQMMIGIVQIMRVKIIISVNLIKFMAKLDLF